MCTPQRKVQLVCSKWLRSWVDVNCWTWASHAKSQSLRPTGNWHIPYQVRLRKFKKPFSGTRMNIHSVYSNICHILPLYTLKTAPLEKLLLVRLPTPASMIQLFTINLPPCSTICDKDRLPAYCGFFIRKSSAPDLELFCVPLCFVFSSFSCCPNQVNPWNHAGLTLSIFLNFHCWSISNHWAHQKGESI